SLLLLTDGDSITPGPASYHHFWIRDAAYMVNALDAYGHHEFTRPIIDRCFDHQTRDGYFRSQQGEWDSNGQVLWMLYEHARLTGTHHAFESRLNALRLAIRWIDRTRSRNASARERKGLLPSGISAEHLGLADQYYWDNFWCLAGIRSYIRLCRLLDRSTECDEALRIYNTFAADLIATFPAESHIPIPAAPGRGTDHGMIGSLSAVYPLQLMDLGAERLSATVRTIDASFFRDDLFMQQFIHSGLNIYLSLQTAHAYLLLGDRDRFFQILTAAIAHATPTGTFPEAIHPITKGGSMGDGHHGWAAAELLLAVKAMFVLETDNTLRLLSGVPASWFDEDRTIFVDRVPIGTGSLSLRVHNTTLSTTILIDPQPRMDSNAAPHTGHTADTWEVHLPFTVSHAFVDGAPLPTFSAGRSGSILRLAAQRSTVLIQRSTEEVTI
ncbi:MAG TPA: hypothetical protein VK470_01630, partial [Bacteroidota bacterium]|nr:hypothetical protein [Bacteroidota bacterium]